MGSSPIISTTNPQGQRSRAARRPGPSGFARLVLATSVPLGGSVGRSGREVGGGLDQLFQDGVDGLVAAGHHALIAQGYAGEVWPMRSISSRW